MRCWVIRGVFLHKYIYLDFSTDHSVIETITLS